MKRPVVLLPPDLQVAQTRRGPVGTVVVQRPYLDAIVEAGGLPLVTPPLGEGAALDQLVELADALVLPGGAFDIDPALYGEAVLPQCGELKPERTALERALFERALTRGLPVLGVGGGMQLSNVVRGGTLWQDLDSQVPGNRGHQQAEPKDRACHEVEVVAGSQLARVVAVAKLPVNSTHHQAVKDLGRGLVITARATDGTIEGLEDPSRPFLLGVQWHPESMGEAPQRAIYRALVEAAARRS
ncbi:MAG: gamma-glutamyl-gamma-aminobutyrate hydrolase family protein [Deltaproteobacteria bacterium]|nr:gamma-glutamyl-gamma-aminobutyrate hydrolase family protein [Deltaproteobacteria bacterium]